MAKHYPLARLGGADRQLLAAEETGSQTGERTRATAMGGVLLTTAGVAAVSMFFALHHAVGVSTGWAVPLALAWGTVIVNIDRLLIITMSGSRGHPVRLAVTVLSRLVLAALIAIVVATPLVLQIFAKDIGAELPILQEKKSAQYNQSLASGSDAKQLAKINAEIKTETAAANGTGSSAVTADQQAIATLNSQIATAETAEQNAYLKWQCELGGLKGSQCPANTSGKVGNGPLSKADEEAYQLDVQKVTALKGQLATDQQTLAADKKIAQLGAGAAQAHLNNLKQERTTLQNAINTLIQKDDAANADDTGLLAQLSALNASSAVNSGLAAAHWTVTALFFVIELLPVMVKCLMLLGDKTAYEEIVEMQTQAALDQAALRQRAETDAAELRAQNIRDLAALEVGHARDVKADRLETELAIIKENNRARQDIELDITRREKGTHIEVNKRFASATREHILASVDEWARGVRDKITQAMSQVRPGSPPGPGGPVAPQQAGNGHIPAQTGGSGQPQHTTVYTDPNYTLPDGDGL